MSTWVIVSWVAVAILTGINVFVFLKLKQASEQMMKMAFPGAKNMSEAMAGMQRMMSGMGAGGGRGGNPFGGGGMNQAQMNAQMKQAMAMLQNMQKGGGGKKR